MMYQNCRELPIHNFSEINLTGDLNLLVKDGTHEESEKVDKWLDIIDEWNGYFGRKGVTRQEAALEVLKLKIDLLSESLKSTPILGVDHYKKVCKILGVPDVKADEVITALINKYENQKLYLDVKKGTFEVDKTLAVLRKHGMNLNRFKDPVSELAACINLLKEND